MIYSQSYVLRDPTHISALYMYMRTRLIKIMINYLFKHWHDKYDVSIEYFKHISKRWYNSEENWVLLKCLTGVTFRTKVVDVCSLVCTSVFVCTLPQGRQVLQREGTEMKNWLLLRISPRITHIGTCILYRTCTSCKTCQAQNEIPFMRTAGELCNFRRIMQMWMCCEVAWWITSLCRFDLKIKTT